MTKLCVDCRHHESRGLMGRFCNRNAVRSVDPVTGFANLNGASSCEDERSDDGSFFKRNCGPRGRFFEPKPGRPVQFHWSEPPQAILDVIRDNPGALKRALRIR